MEFLSYSFLENSHTPLQNLALSPLSHSFFKKKICFSCIKLVFFFPVPYAISELLLLRRWIEIWFWTSLLNVIDPSAHVLLVTRGGGRLFSFIKVIIIYRDRNSSREIIMIVNDKWIIRNCDNRRRGWGGGDFEDP